MEWQRLILTDYYDGPRTGIAEKADVNQSYYFDAVVDPYDAEDNRRYIFVHLDFSFSELWREGIKTGDVSGRLLTLHPGRLSPVVEQAIQKGMAGLAEAHEPVRVEWT